MFALSIRNVAQTSLAIRGVIVADNNSIGIFTIVLNARIFPSWTNASFFPYIGLMTLKVWQQTTLKSFFVDEMPNLEVLSITLSNKYNLNFDSYGDGDDHPIHIEDYENAGAVNSTSRRFMALFSFGLSIKQLEFSFFVIFWKFRIGTEILRNRWKLHFTQIVVQSPLTHHLSSWHQPFKTVAVSAATTVFSIDFSTRADLATTPKSSIYSIEI